MAVGIREFQTAAEALVVKQRQNDFDDLNNGIAGLDTGRNSRFLNSGDGKNLAEKRRKSEELIKLTALQQMLQDPIYKAQYEKTMELLNNVERVTELALEQAEQELWKSEQELHDMRNNASRLPDGTIVFKDQNGTVWTEDGQRISTEDADSIVWKQNSPAYEDFIQTKQKAIGAQNRADDIRTYQTDVLGDARNRMADEGNPPSKEELKDIQDDIIEQAPPIVKAALESEQVAAPTQEYTANIAKPSI